MALWAKAQQLQGESLRQVHAVYGNHFPIEVRHFLAPWIENKMLTEIDPENAEHYQYAANFVETLIKELENKAASMETEELFLTRIKLQEAAEYFKVQYLNNPMMLIRVIRHCLGTEMALVKQAEGVIGASPVHQVMSPSPCLPRNNLEITQQIETLRQRTQETGENLRQMEQEHEAFALEYHELTKVQASIQHVQNNPLTQSPDVEKQLRAKKESLAQKVNQRVVELLKTRALLAEKHKDTVVGIGSLQGRVLDDELIRWKREQQLAGNGVPFVNSLDIIQEWCEALSEIIWQNRQQIKDSERLRTKFAIDPPGSVDILPTLNTQITQLLSSLVTSTFIIEKQPPQVMKTNTRFTSSVRLLVGPKLNVHMSPPQVSVSIISEAQANTLLKNDKMAKGDTSGEILNNTGSMEYHKSTRHLSVHFRNMQLRKIKRTEKKGSESVMDEKFSLLFQSKFSVGGGELVFQVWTLSLPVVVIVHGNQEPHAWATVTWDNAFAEPGRIPFVVPDRVPWGQVSETLSTKFKAATGRGLTSGNLKYLGSKAFRNHNAGDNPNGIITWSQFCKEPLPDRNFTFWEWFYAIKKLTREHLRGPWVDNIIHGFISRNQTVDMLKLRPRGTFMLRYSDSELGGITIAWHGENDEILMIQPFNTKDFTIRSLADRIFDLKYLTHLYPDIPKDVAFHKYYTPADPADRNATNGYVRQILVAHVPAASLSEGMLSYPNTPASNHMERLSPESQFGQPSPSVLRQAAETPQSVSAHEIEYPIIDDDFPLEGFEFNSMVTDMIQSYKAQ
ncbi:signal transducer and activator of transcription 5B-like isoform X2 [Artemia franciscana]|uniref:Signal transducer and activator of transcription n=2 Tax=Artemia franciscana TaxID=6661 RepID=A0AA88HR80_ARTSF|nr:hypothetical protein QYM36_009597 [Artemia franciscana]